MQSISYRHVIITRFSVRFNMVTEQKGALFDLGRLTRRMKVFKTVCIPSILKQKSKHFYWVLLVDKELPKVYRQELDSIADKHKFIRVLEWKPESYKLSQISWLQDAGIDIDVTHLITTRLDDDDALHLSYTQAVQNYYKKQGFRVRFIQFITFPRGLIWKSQRGTVGMMNPFNMDFIALGMTLIVNVKTVPVNVYGFNHAKLKTSFKMRLKNPPYIYKWLTNKLGRTITYRHFQLRVAMISIPTRFPMYIYAMHGYNDSAAKYYSGLFNKGGAYAKGDIKKLMDQFGISVKEISTL